MQEILLIIVLVLLIISIVISLLFLLKKNKGDSSDLKKELEMRERNQEKLFKLLTEQITIRVQEANNSNLSFFTNFVNSQRSDLLNLQAKMEQLMKDNAQSMELARQSLEKGLSSIMESNEKKLEQMRITVDEKLNDSLQKRLGESFQLISERLEAVHKGLGDMQNLASGVGDLKKVLTNVKTRGTLGEVQLGNILEQLLTPNQYQKNVAVRKNTQERVDYAIIFPGKDNESMLLPIDSKFPMDDYQRLCVAAESGTEDEIDEYRKKLLASVKTQAKSISEKYINVPKTTDFAIMFLATEGLFAEVLRTSGLFEEIQSKFRVLLCGPTTISAILSSFQMGFKTLSIEKRTSEVWKLLTAFRQDFTTFTELLSKTQKKLLEASDTIEIATKRTHKIEKKLSDVSDYEPLNLLETISPDTED